ncbi:MAG: response regulator [Acidobacteriia bacterium]|nr:response regulator [Terriglobia bacterium]
MQVQEQSFLIVDDEPDACWALERILERQRGTRCRRAATAEAALGEVRRGSFALALLDAKLPDMDGLELARHVRAIDGALPIIIVSGYFYQDDVAIQAALKQGLIQCFVAKPFRHEEIVRAVAEAIQQRGGRK